MQGSTKFLSRLEAADVKIVLPVLARSVLEKAAMYACGSRLQGEHHTWDNWLQIHKRIALLCHCEYLAVRDAEAPEWQLLHGSTT